MLKGTPSIKYTLIPQAGGPVVDANLLAKNLTAGVLPKTDGEKTNFILVPDGASVKFAKPNGTGSLAANKAYLQIPTGDLPGHELTITFDDGETTGISEIEKMRDGENEKFFDLQGRRVAQPTKGLYIVNGKKVIIK